jgi:HAD superfamily hydrolase (TIGR01459 family)
MKFLAGLSTVADLYDGLLLDLWGVIHDGTHLYPGVHAALTQLRKSGKKIGMLSNAPRRARKVELVLNGLGIEPELYDFVLSSGETGFHWMASDQNNLGKRYYYIGPDKDLDVADGLNFTRVKTLAEAEFVLNVGFGSEVQNTEDWLPVLRDAQRAGLTMVCLNPDLEVVKLSGERFACAGVLAHAYEDLGGQVIWFGKPYPAVYEECLRRLSTIGKPRILAIGDSLDTDIPGALSFGVDCALVTGGILKTQTAEHITNMCKERNLAPTYIMPQLSW